jgi:hypothetical protein
MIIGAALGNIIASAIALHIDATIALLERLHELSGEARHNACAMPIHEPFPPGAADSNAR